MHSLLERLDFLFLNDWHSAGRHASAVGKRVDAVLLRPRSRRRRRHETVLDSSAIERRRFREFTANVAQSLSRSEARNAERLRRTAGRLARPDWVRRSALNLRHRRERVVHTLIHLGFTAPVLQRLGSLTRRAANAAIRGLQTSQGERLAALHLSAKSFVLHARRGSLTRRRWLSVLVVIHRVIVVSNVHVLLKVHKRRFVARVGAKVRHALHLLGQTLGILGVHHHGERLCGVRSARNRRPGFVTARARGFRTRRGGLQYVRRRPKHRSRPIRRARRHGKRIRVRPTATANATGTHVRIISKLNNAHPAHRHSTIIPASVGHVHIARTLLLHNARNVHPNDKWTRLNHPPRPFSHL